MIQIDSIIKSSRDVTIKASFDGVEYNYTYPIQLWSSPNYIICLEYEGNEEKDVTLDLYAQNDLGTNSQSYSFVFHYNPNQIPSAIMSRGWFPFQNTRESIRFGEIDEIFNPTVFFVHPVPGKKLKFYYQLNNNEAVFVKEVISEEYNMNDENAELQTETIHIDVEYITQALLAKIFFISEDGIRSNIIMRNTFITRMDYIKCVAVGGWDEKPLGFANDIYNLSCMAYDLSLIHI